MGHITSINWDAWRRWGSVSGALRDEQFKGLDSRSLPLEIPTKAPRGVCPRWTHRLHLALFHHYDHHQGWIIILRRI